MFIDDSILGIFIEESRELLAGIENDLLTIEAQGSNVPSDLVNKVFRAAHSIKGGAGMLDLKKIQELAHKTENVLDLIRSHQLPPNPETINILLQAFDKLKALLAAPQESDNADIADDINALVGLCALKVEQAIEQAPSATKNGSETENASISPGPKVSMEALSSPQETSIRVQVEVIENLMNLAGELVLSRNQLIEAISKSDTRCISGSGKRISQVTSELQEAIMQTRMQPINNIFSKLPRLVRDQSRSLGKEIELVIDGRDVEMDRTIIEGLKDPLTHMVRNAIDHGIETVEQRKQAGKSSVGKVCLRAYHEAGQVVIEIADDGKGIHTEKIAKAALDKGLAGAEQLRAMSDKDKLALILLPGLSTAERVTDLSGRGVGMDVVKVNLDKLAGKMEIFSEVGKGTTFRIKLPLTLAIIPCLIVTAGGERFAIPELNVVELIRVPAEQVQRRVEVVGDANVLVLRDQLVPIARLADVLCIKRSYRPGRRFHADSDLNIVIVSSGVLQFGLVVDALHCTEEIVVKPLGRHLKSLGEYTGATIMGDGRVALILDASGIAAKAQLSSVAGSGRARKLVEETQDSSKDLHSVLTFYNGPSELCAVPLAFVHRVQQINQKQIEKNGGRRTMQYRGASLPLVTLKDVANVEAIDFTKQELMVIILMYGKKEFGLLGAMPVDAIELHARIDQQTLRQKGVAGSTIIREKTTLIVEPRELLEEFHKTEH
ncbi:MAG: chemotaxis protein CheA [Deltaproteobacteria bacterium]|nr:chemotaxis protein CheA [Deltaproteobacteria bacterium]